MCRWFCERFWKSDDHIRCATNMWRRAFSQAQHFELLLSADFTLARYLRNISARRKCLRRTKTNKFSNHMALRLANKDSLFIFIEVEENQQRETILIGFVMSSLHKHFLYRKMKKTDSFLVAALDQVYVPWNNMPGTISVEKSIPRFSISNSRLQIRNFSINLRGVDAGLKGVVGFEQIIFFCFKRQKKCKNHCLKSEKTSATPEQYGSSRISRRKYLKRNNCRLFLQDIRKGMRKHFQSRTNNWHVCAIPKHMFSSWKLDFYG